MASVSSSTDLDSMSDHDLYSKIIRYTSLPQYVNTIASQFVRDVMKNRPYVTFHWRFDNSDWMSSCRHNRAPTPRRKLCSFILSLKPPHIANAILLGLTEVNDVILKDVTTNDVISDVYIATPPSQYGVMEELEKLLRVSQNITMHYGIHMRRYVIQNFPHCDWLLPNLNDVLSNSEMTVCVKSHTFYRATSSSWSTNVVLSRPRSKFNPRILDLLRTANHTS
uniref:Peptide-O-fucosyltransferase n=1 Tax=Ciona savignyi TaxID=51511 RepID=H2YJH7_CIOSA